MIRNLLLVPVLVLIGCVAPAPRGVHAITDPSVRTADPGTDLLTEFQRRYPSLRFYRDEEGLHIRLPGSEEPPLYLVDGVPRPATAGGALWGLGLHEIEDVEILRRPSRLVADESRGAHGVLLITTRRR